MQAVEFSLGGSALIKRLRRLGALKWIPQNLTYQIMLAVLIAWAPLFMITAYKGLAFGSTVQIPFLFDLVQHARFLVALPSAIALGKFVNPRARNVLNTFLRNGIVSSKDFARFENAISRARRLTSSMIPELAILVLIYAPTSWGLHRQVATGMSSWHHPHITASIPEAASRGWFLWVSMPLLLFTWCLWAWRLSVWAYLLFRISRLDLRLIATHPDRAGGLGFVHVAMRSFWLLVFAISSILCASIGEEILFKGASLHSYEMELALFFVVCLAVILGPLLAFTPILMRAKLENWGRYGSLASSYVQGFDEKWASQSDRSREDLLGTADLQSLADLGNSYTVITEMRTILPNRTTVGIFAIAYAAPALPLLGSVISLRHILSEVYVLLVK